MHKVRRSLLFSFIDRYGTTAIGFLGTMVLSRLLTPADFGIFSVAASFVMLIEVVRDFGVGTYLVQEPHLTNHTVRTAFTVSLALSTLCAIILLIVASPVAAFYNNPNIARIMPVLAASFMLVPLGMPSMSLLRRDMEFHSLAAVGIGSSAANLIATALLAVSGFGYMSLVWGSLIGNTVRTAASIACRPTFWAFRPGLTEWRKVFAFGSYSAATAIVNVFHDTLPQLIIGRLLGFNAVGLFGRAVGVCQLPDRLFTNALMPVLLPALAEHARSSNDLKPVYLRSLTYTTALQWPILLCLAVLAEPVVRILLGEQWLAAAPLVRIMALAALTLFPAFMTYPLLVATGGVRDTLTMSLISIPPSVILIFLASFHGLQAVAATQFITGPLQVYVALIFVRRRIDFTWGEFISALGPSAVIALCAATPPMAMVIYAGFRFNLSMPAMILASAGAVAGWVAGLFITHHPLLAEVRAVVSGLPWHMLRPARSP